MVRQEPTEHISWARSCGMQSFCRADEERRAQGLNATYIVKQQEACTGSCDSALEGLVFVVGKRKVRSGRSLEEKAMVRL